MLSKNSTRNAKLKQVLVLPLLVVAVTFFSNCKNNHVIPIGDYTIKKNGDVATYKGNTIKLKITPPDKKGNTWADLPITLNGKKVYSVYSERYKNDADLDTYPSFSIKSQTMINYLFTELKDDFGKLNDGGYNIGIGQTLINEKGEVVWYHWESSPIMKLGLDYEGGGTRHKEFDDKIMRLLYNAPKYTPGMIAGKPVPVEMNFYEDKYCHIEVKNHHAILFQCTKYN